MAANLWCTLLLGFSTAAVAEDWKNKTYIQQSFESIALGSEYSDQLPQIRKWQQPIFFSFQHDVADKTLHEKLSATHLQQLSAITGHSILPATESAPANLQIIFTDESRLLGYLRDDIKLNGNIAYQLSRNSVCIAHFSVNHRSEIHRAQVIIPVDRARAHAKLLACIVEELTQVMGLPNDDVAVFPSVFNDRSHDNFLSGLDFVLLKLLYQPALKPGMDKQQSRTVLETIMQQAIFQQWLDEADQTVRATGLYPLME